MKARVTPSLRATSHDFADGEAVRAVIDPVLGTGVVAGIAFTCCCSSRTSRSITLSSPPRREACLSPPCRRIGRHQVS